MAQKKKVTKKTTAKHSEKEKKPSPARKKGAEQTAHGQNEMLFKLAPFLICVAAATFGMILFLTKSTGSVGGFIASALRGVFSVGAYLIPVLLVNHAVFFKKDVENGSYRYKWLFSLICIIFADVVFALFSNQSGGLSVKELYESGVALTGGGFVGGALHNLLVPAFGKVLTGMFAVVALLLFGSFLFGMTPAEMFRAVFPKREKNCDDDIVLETPETAAARIKEKQEYAAQQAEKSASSRKRKEYEVNVEVADPAAKPEDKIEDEKITEINIKEVPQDDGDDIRNLNPKKAVGKLALKPEKSALNSKAVPEPEKTITQELKDIFYENEDTAVAERFSAIPAAESAEAAEATLIIEKSDLAQKVEPPQALAEDTYRFPPISLLQKGPEKQQSDFDEQNETAKKLVDALQSFGVMTKIRDISKGPTVTRYELQPDVGVRVKSIENLSNDIARALAAKGIRIEAPIPGKETVGIEIPNKAVAMVYVRELIETEQFKKNKNKVYTCLGEDVAGAPVFCDLSKMPHLLIAGATGMGKSVCINSIIVSILYKSRPDEVKFIMIDPKKVELSVYNGIPHLLVPVVSDPKKAAGALCWAVNEMERRFTLLEGARARNITYYNESANNDPEREKLPLVIIIIDELADLMMTAREDVETSINRLAQKARAAGMHLVIGTQRPSTDVITGLIKANIPSRIAFTVASIVDSRVILDMAGADKLLGRGDMLYAPVGDMKKIRVQGAYVSEEEVESITEFLKSNVASEYSEDIMESIEREAARCGEKKRGAVSEEGEGIAIDDETDLLLWPAIKCAVETGGIATSLLQRKFSVGYGRAAKIIDMMEKMGVIGGPNGSKPRELRITSEQYLEMRQQRDDQYKS